MKCLAYYTNSDGKSKSKSIQCIMRWDGIGWKSYSPTKKNIQLMRKRLAPNEAIVINEYNDLLNVPTDMIDTNENIVAMIACADDIWYKTETIEIGRKSNLLKKLTQFLQSKFYSRKK